LSLQLGLNLALRLRDLCAEPIPRLGVRGVGALERADGGVELLLLALLARQQGAVR